MSRFTEQDGNDLQNAENGIKTKLKNLLLSCMKSGVLMFSVTSSVAYSTVLGGTSCPCMDRTRTPPRQPSPPMDRSLSASRSNIPVFKTDTDPLVNMQV